MKPHKDTIFVLVALLGAMLVSASFGYLVTDKPQEPQPATEWSAVELLHKQNGTLTEWQMLQLAIIFTESKGNTKAVGKAGDFGAYQMLRIYVEETNRVSGSNYSHADAFDIDKAIDMFNRLQDHYNPEHDIDKAIKLHNRSAAYRAAVYQNMELIKRMEYCRKRLTEYRKND